jgi:YesN/AraC family two-component response regulator
MNDLSFYELSQDLKNSCTITADGPIWYPSHFHKKVELTYVKRGEVTSCIAGEIFVAKQDEILFIPDYYPHSYSCTEDAQRIVVLPPSTYYTDVSNVLKNHTFQSLLNDVEFNKTIILPILEQMLVAQDREKGSDENKFLIVKGMVDVLFGYLSIGYAHTIKSKPRETDLVFQILEYIDEHYAEDITLQSISDKFHYNKYYFSKLFNSYLGESLNNYVNSVRVRNIAQQISNSKLGKENITNLAYQNGFNSMPSFYRAFQKIFHCSPLEYFKLN